MLMMRPLFIALVLLLAGTPADAQRPRDRDAVGQRGDFALAFEATWLAVQPFMGGVGGRYWIGDRTVVTGSVGVGTATLDTDDDATVERDESSYRIGLGVGVERHLRTPRGRVSPFVALGTEFTMTGRDDEFVLPDGSAQSYEQSGQAVGAAAFVGAEYRFAPGLTLAAAHSVGLTYEWGESVRIVNGQPEGDDYRQLLAGTGLTSLILSIYF